MHRNESIIFEVLRQKQLSFHHLAPQKLDSFIWIKYFPPELYF